MSDSSTSTTNTDEVRKAVRDVAKRGSFIALASHAAAFVVLVVFSLGSLVGLTGDALTRLLTETHHGWADAPLAIEIVVSTLLVPAMDIGMFYAATMIRILKQRRQPGISLHVWVIICVGAIECATYVYMSATYDAPHTFAVWALIIARGFAAPLLATYLSLAMTPPVGSGDILYLTESLLAVGVLSDMAREAHDQAAPMDRKQTMYRAVALMSPADQARLDRVIAAERATRIPLLTTPDTAQAAHPAPEPPPNTSPDGPRGGGRDDAAQGGRDHDAYAPPVPNLSGLTPLRTSSLPPARIGGNGRTPAARNQAGNQPRKRSKKTPRKSPGNRMLRYAQINHQRVLEVRGWLAAGEMVSQQRIRKAYGVSNDAAKRILAEAGQQRALHVV